MPSTMIMFKLDPFAPLLDTIPVLSHLGQKANIKTSPSVLKLTILPLSRHFIAALQMLPEFFNFYTTNETQHSRIPLDIFYITMLHMKAHGFSSMYFTLRQSVNKLRLSFHGSSYEPSLSRELDLLPFEVDKMEKIEKIDYGKFVSIDSHDFRRVVLALHASAVLVSLTDSRVTFSSLCKDIVFTKEERKCIIGGLMEGEEFKFSITLRPLDFFLDLSKQAKRAWLFMSINFSTIIILPFGTRSQFWVYFP